MLNLMTYERRNVHDTVVQYTVEGEKTYSRNQKQTKEEMESTVILKVLLRSI